MRVYADNAATTAISKKALDAMLTGYQKGFGNPSSLHKRGQEASKILLKAREQIAECIKASPKEIYFTGSGSESDNQAIFTAARIGAQQGKKHIITSEIEHHAVLNVMHKLENEGFEITYLPVEKNGRIHPSLIQENITDETCLVSVMMVNNETGVIQPVKEIGKICKQSKILFHTDAVQAVGHVSIDMSLLPIDFLSFSAHKFHGPKGVGVLYCRIPTEPETIIFGGGQERGKRAGTENTPAISAMGVAFQEALDQIEEKNEYMRSLKMTLINELSSIPGFFINGAVDQSTANILNIGFEHIDNEMLLLLLDGKGIEVSAGSACTSGSLDPSHVLLAMGLSESRAKNSIRISLSYENTMEEIVYMTDSIKEIVQNLR